jgi:hypothetical protein
MLMHRLLCLTALRRSAHEIGWQSSKLNESIPVSVGVQIMMRNHFFCVRLLAFLLAAVWMCHHANAEKQCVRDLVQEAIEAESTGDDVWDIHQELFVAAPVQRLEKLKTEKHDGIAIHASWELMRRTMKRVIASDDKGSKWNRVDKGAMQRFIGFVEGRLEINLPQGFETMLLRACE